MPVCLCIYVLVNVCHCMTDCWCRHAKPGSRRIDRERSRPCSQHYTHSPVHSVTGRSPDTKLDVGHRESPATSPRSRHVLSPGSSSRTRHGTAYRSRSPDYDYKKSRDWTVGSDYEMSQQQYSTSMVLMLHLLLLVLLCCLLLFF